MKRTIRSMVAMGLMLGLMACSSESGNGTAASPKSYPLHNAADLQAEVASIQESEKELATLGMKIKASSTYSTGTTTTTYAWDDRTPTPANVSEQNVLTALERFADKAEGYVAKYSGEYRVDASDKIYTINASLKKELDGKSGLARKTIASIRDSVAKKTAVSEMTFVAPASTDRYDLQAAETALANLGMKFQPMMSVGGATSFRWDDSAVTPTGTTIPDMITGLENYLEKMRAFQKKYASTASHYSLTVSENEMLKAKETLVLQAIQAAKNYR